MGNHCPHVGRNKRAWARQEEIVLPDVRARVCVVIDRVVVAARAHVRDGQVGVPGRDVRVEDVQTPAVPTKVEEFRVRGLDPQGVAVAAGGAAVELKKIQEAFFRDQ